MLDDGSIGILQNHLLQTLFEVAGRFVGHYTGVRARLVRIPDGAVQFTASQHLDRFEGAYHYFMEDPSISQVLQDMAAVGNLLAVFEMMDIAFLLKRQSENQVSAFVLGGSSEDAVRGSAGLSALFDDKFKAASDFVRQMVTVSATDEGRRPMTSRALRTLSQKIGQALAETATSVADWPSLTGFAAAWSVLDFVFCVTELRASKPEDGAYVRFGEGVQVAAAALLAISGQRPLARALRILGRIQRAAATDFGSLPERVEKLLSIARVAGGVITDAGLGFEALRETG